MDTKDAKAERAARRIKILRITQSTLGSILSLAIAIFQAKVYATFTRTQNQAGAWPNTADVAPTLILLSVSVVSLVLDICLIIGFTMPGHAAARVAFQVASGAQYVVASAKVASYALTAVVSRTSYNFGMNSGNNNDLWSWTCTDQAATMDSVNNAESNCNTQLASWVFAMAQVAIEGIGAVIKFLVWRAASAKESADAAAAAAAAAEEKDTVDEERPAAGAKPAAGARPAAGGRGAGGDAEYEKISAWVDSADGKLQDLTPKFDISA